MPLVALPVLLLLALCTVCVVVVLHLAMMLIRPPRMSDGKALYVLRRMSPGDVALPFEALAFTVIDEAGGATRRLKLAAWWIAAAAPSMRTCIVVHGYGDAKVGALAWAPLLRSLGWNLLLVDLRGHGESDGVYCTGGDRESRDLGQVIDQLRAARPNETERLALFGISLGGAVALAAAAGRDDVDAVVAESVFTDFRDAARVHGRLIQAPLQTLVPLAICLGGWWAGARFADVRPLDTVGRCRCRVMLIHGDADAFVPAEQLTQLAAAIYARGNPRDDHLVVEGAGHCLSIVADQPLYTARLENFLTNAEGERLRLSSETLPP